MKLSKCQKYSFICLSYFEAFFSTLFILSWSIRFLMENWIKHGPFCLKWYFHMSFYPLKIGIMNLRLSLPKCCVFSIHKGWNPHLALWLRWKFLRSTFRVCQSIHYTYLFDRKSFKHEKNSLNIHHSLWRLRKGPTRCFMLYFVSSIIIFISRTDTR